MVGQNGLALISGADESEENYTTKALKNSGPESAYRQIRFTVESGAEKAVLHCISVPWYRMPAIPYGWFSILASNGMVFNNITFDI